MKSNLFPDICDETCVRSTSRMQPLSRRTFLRYAGLGTAGTTLLLSGSLDIFGGDPRTAVQQSSSAQTHVTGAETTDAELGEITLDGLMLTYFSIPHGFANSTFTFGKNFSTAFTLRLPQSPGTSLTGMVPAGRPFSDSLSQHTSSWVKDAIALRSLSEGSAAEKTETFSRQEASDPLQIYGLKNPKLQFSGSPDRLMFCFSDMGKRSFNLGREVSSETAASMYSQYVTDPAQLFPPRFYWLDILGSDGDTSFDFALPSRLMVRNGITAAATARITDQTGFHSQRLIEAFAPGNEVEITYHSAQEYPSTSLMELQTAPANGDARIYIDRVFKTYVMTSKSNRG